MPRPLNILRLQAGLTQRALAHRARVAQATIARLELGQRHSSSSLRQKIADALGVAIADVQEFVDDYDVPPRR